MKSEKYGIITHYDVHNHGAMLQLYSLKQVLRLEGIEAKALRFEKNFDFRGIEIKSKYYLSFRSIPIYFQYLIKGGIGKFIYNLRKRNTLNKFKQVHYINSLIVLDGTSPLEYSPIEATAAATRGSSLASISDIVESPSLVERRAKKSESFTVSGETAGLK